MITFREACIIANKELKKQDNIRMLPLALVVEEGWLFGGSPFEDDCVVYGNCPIKIYADTGRIEYFPLSNPENLDKYNAINETRNIPEEYIRI